MQRLIQIIKKIPNLAWMIVFICAYHLFISITSGGKNEYRVLEKKIFEQFVKSKENIRKSIRDEVAAIDKKYSRLQKSQDSLMTISVNNDEKLEKQYNSILNISYETNKKLIDYTKLSSDDILRRLRAEEN